MKNLKLYLSIMLLLIVVSCKKKDEVAPEETKIDLTKYFITWEVPTQFAGGRTYNLPALTLFENEGKTKSYYFGSSTSPTLGSYNLNGNQLAITTSNQNLVLTLEDGKITGITGSINEIKNAKLQELPSTNQFTGNYNGMLTSWMVNTSFPFSYSFNQTQFGEDYNGEPQLDYVLNPINNVFAISSINSVLRYFLMVDGKLTIVRLKSGGTNAESYLIGTFSKDQ